MLRCQTGDVIGATVVVKRQGKWQDRYKLHLCVCPQRGWYLYFNKHGHWDGSFPVRCADDPVLDRDCYIGCGHIQDIAISVFEDDGRILGRLSDATLSGLAQYIPTVVTLADEEKDIIVANLLDCVGG